MLIYIKLITADGIETVVQFPLEKRGYPPQRLYRPITRDILQWHTYTIEPQVVDSFGCRVYKLDPSQPQFTYREVMNYESP